uniref:Ribosomal protein L16 n=1 Tax=Cafileria marina TaxID=2557541 RepID=A0A5B9IKT2_9STRA|nr:ribosomal protein L16 [Cafileria marina]QEF30262.1 ribosomal protein L16 [Cafileria marina]
MNLFPKQTKFNKYQKSRIKSCLENKSIKPRFGFFAIQALEQCKLTSKQLTSIQKILQNKIKKEAKVWLRCYPDIPVTKKPTEVRMGKGKGSVHQWIAKIPKGKIIFEITGKNHNFIKKVLNNCLNKLPVKTIIITKLDKIK